MRIIAIIFYFLLVLFGISFAALNSTVVSVNFYFITISLPVSVFAMLVFGVGILVGFILFVFKYWRLKLVNSKIRSQLKLT